MDFTELHQAVATPKMLVILQRSMGEQRVNPGRLGDALICAEEGA
jgi:hypothetical protein